MVDSRRIDALFSTRGPDSDGHPLPILPPGLDVRVWTLLVRVMFHTPGFLAMLLLKADEPTSFDITPEFLVPMPDRTPDKVPRQSRGRATQ